MTSIQKLNVLGLCLGMIGGLILFFFGSPQPSFEQTTGIAVEDNTVLPDGRTAREHGDEAKAMEERYTYISRIGLLLIVAGFACQLPAALKSNG